MPAPRRRYESSHPADALRAVTDRDGGAMDTGAPDPPLCTADESGLTKKGAIQIMTFCACCFVSAYAKRGYRWRHAARHIAVPGAIRRPLVTGKIGPRISARIQPVTDEICIQNLLRSKDTGQLLTCKITTPAGSAAAKLGVPSATARPWLHSPAVSS